MEEEFRKDAETKLVVSSLGRVIGKRGRELKLKQSRYGYLSVAYTKNGLQRFVFVHRLVARNFIPNPMNLPCVNHLDECKQNNSVENLEWCTYKYNANYGTRNERAKRSVRESGHTRSITLTNDQEIRSYVSLVDAERELALRKGAAYDLLIGKVYSTNGWHILGEDAESHSVKRKKITLTDGKSTCTFESLHQAARKIGVCKANIKNILTGRLKSVKGWHLPDVDLAQRKRNPTPKKICVEKDGVRKTFNSLIEMASKVGCKASIVSDLSRGVVKSCYGWRLVTEDNRDRKVDHQLAEMAMEPQKQMTEKEIEEALFAKLRAERAELGMPTGERVGRKKGSVGGKGSKRKGRVPEEDAGEGMYVAEDAFEDS